MILTLDGVAVARSGRLLLRDVTLALAPGAAAVVTGPNGVGKSSLLRVCAGLLSPLTGTVDRAGTVALGDERAALDPDLPLARALALWARVDGGAVALDAVGMAHLAQVPVRLLSTGQRRRATLARVIASRAALWLLDEPANGLDAGGVAMLECVIARHRADGGAVLVATHQPLGLPDAATLALAPA